MNWSANLYLLGKPKLSWREPEEFYEFIGKFRTPKPKWLNYGSAGLLSLMLLASTWPQAYSQGKPFPWGVFFGGLFILFGFFYGLSAFAKSKYGRKSLSSPVEVFKNTIRKGKQVIKFVKVTDYWLADSPTPILILFSGAKAVFVSGAPDRSTQQDLEIFLRDKNISRKKEPIDLAVILKPSPFLYHRLLSIFGGWLLFILILGVLSIVLINEKNKRIEQQNVIAEQLQLIKKELRSAGVPKEKVKSLTEFEQLSSTPGFKMVVQSIPFLAIAVMILLIWAAKNYFDTKELKMELEKKETEKLKTTKV